jgi:hypothetical protein
MLDLLHDFSHGIMNRPHIFDRRRFAHRKSDQLFDRAELIGDLFDQRIIMGFG